MPTQEHPMESPAPVQAPPCPSPAPGAHMPMCQDFDQDCADMPSLGKSFVNCWLYQPERGHCPYLQQPTI